MAFLHALGGATGGATAAGVLWLAFTPIRTLLPTWIAATLFAVAGLASVGVDLGWWQAPIHSEQVPKVWFGRFGPTRSYALYGLTLGAGVLTHVPYAITFTVFAACTMSASIVPAVLAGLSYGVGRTFPVGPVNLSKYAVEWFGRAYPQAQKHLPAVSAFLSTLLIWLVVRG
jgi:hypothetical protein